VRHWLNSLHGRLVLLLLLALLVAQGIALVFQVFDRRELMRDFNETMVMRRLPTTLMLLSEVPADDRPRFAAAFSTSITRFSVAAQPMATAAPDYLAFARQIALQLGRPATDLRVSRADAPLAIEPPVRWSGDTLRIAVRLAPDAWLNLEQPLGPPWHHVIGPLGVSLLLSALAVLGVVALVARRITRPLAALTDAADRFGRGDPMTDLPETGPEDIRRTVQAFNRMSARLRRFIADRTLLLAAISHDLRTPITALRLRSEMVDDAETRERIQRSLDEMQRMVEATLQFARAEAVEEPAQVIDVAVLAGQVCADLEDAGGVASCEAAPGLQVLARPTALGRALRNVVENAVFYAGEARLRAEATADGVRIRVDDAGPGVPPAERERVFEPFVRLETSRSTETGGSGLGLATARTTIHGHGGTIRLDDSPLGGLRVEILLPPA
jgi:signal transduction histidine kinase